MRVQVNQAVAVGPRNGFGEIPVVGDQGTLAGVDSVRGGLLVRPDDVNPERIILDDTLLATPVANVRDRFTTPVLGVVVGTYNIENLDLATPRPSPATPGSSSATCAHRLCCVDCEPAGAVRLRHENR
jgi:uncharacterized protein